MSTQPPPYPTFEAGNKLRDEVTAAKLRAMAQSIIYDVVGGSADFLPGRGTSIKIPRKINPESRCYVLTSVTETALPATVALDAIAYDIESDRTSAVMATISAGVITLTKPGFFKVAYTGNMKLSLSGATTATPGQVVATAKLKLGGVALESTRSDVSATLTPNFDGFVTNGGEIEQTVDLGGVTGKTDAWTGPLSVPAGTGGGGEATWAPTASTVDWDSLDGAQKIGTTIDAGQSVDVTTSLEVISGSAPSGYAYGTVASQALIQVIRNTSGEIKILDGAVERDPTIQIYAEVSGGSASSLTATLSILKL